MTSGFGPNPNTNLLRDSVSDLTPKPATDSDWRPKPKDSVKSRNLLHNISLNIVGLVSVLWALMLTTLGFWLGLHSSGVRVVNNGF